MAKVQKKRRCGHALVVVKRKNIERSAAYPFSFNNTIVTITD